MKITITIVSNIIGSSLVEVAAQTEAAIPKLSASSTLLDQEEKLLQCSKPPNTNALDVCDKTKSKWHRGMYHQFFSAERRLRDDRASPEYEKWLQ